MASSIDDLAFQTAFGRILAEPELNERFVDDPWSVGQELGLDRAQIEALIGAGLAKLRAFAHSLSSKRVGLLKKVCPATYELVHQRGRLGELAGSFVRGHPPHESREFPNRTIRDGFWFLGDIEQRAHEGELGDPLIAEVARFEHAVLSVTTLEEALESARLFAELASARPDLPAEWLLDQRPWCGPHARVDAFTVDILRIVGDLAEGRTLDPPETREAVVLFSKMPGWRNVNYAAINRGTRDLIAACDGKTTCREIIDRELGKRPSDKGPSSFISSCLKLLRRLESMNVVSFAAARA